MPSPMSADSREWEMEEPRLKPLSWTESLSRNKLWPINIKWILPSLHTASALESSVHIVLRDHSSIRSSLNLKSYLIGPEIIYHNDRCTKNVLQDLFTFPRTLTIIDTLMTTLWRDTDCLKQNPYRSCDTFTFPKTAAYIKSTILWLWRRVQAA